MFEHRKKRRALARTKPGDGRSLRTFRWWQMLGRSVFHLDPELPGRPERYTVDVEHLGDPRDGDVKAQLFVDDRQQAVCRVPATFPVHGGVIEVATSNVGMKRCHFVSDTGDSRQLRPDSRSAEGRRARFEARHPVASRVVGMVSVVVLVIGIGLLLLQLVDVVSELPPVQERFGNFDAPISLPIWLNIALTLLAAAASTERALRMRYSWLDTMGN